MECSDSLASLGKPGCVRSLIALCRVVVNLGKVTKQKTALVFLGCLGSLDFPLDKQRLEALARIDASLRRSYCTEAEKIV